MFPSHKPYSSEEPPGAFFLAFAVAYFGLEEVAVSGDVFYGGAVAARIGAFLCFVVLAFVAAHLSSPPRKKRLNNNPQVMMSTVPW